MRFKMLTNPVPLKTKFLLIKNGDNFFEKVGITFDKMSYYYSFLG